jgi:hypothetical protein
LWYFNFSRGDSFPRSNSGGLLLEAVQVGKELQVDEVAQVVAGHGVVVVRLAVLAPGGGPRLPAIGPVEDEGVLLAFQRGFVGLVLLQPVQIFEEEEPRGLLGVIQLGGAAGRFPEDVVDVLEGLFKPCQGVFSIVAATVRNGPAKRKGRVPPEPVVPRRAPFGEETGDPEGTPACPTSYLIFSSFSTLPSRT